MIEVRNVSKSYGGVAVLDDVTCTIPQGGITSIIGPNGAGKSTLLSLISRLQPLESGAVSVAGLDIAATPSRDLARTMAILRQENHLTMRLTVRDLVAAPVLGVAAIGDGTAVAPLHQRGTSAQHVMRRRRGSDS